MEDSIQKTMDDFVKPKFNQKEYTRKWTQNNEKWRRYLRDYLKEYRKTNKGKESMERYHSKNRGLKWIPLLPNIFPEDIPVDGHHVDGKRFVVPLPSSLHERTPRKYKNKHLEQANKWVEFYYNMNPYDFIFDGFREAK